MPTYRYRCAKCGDEIEEWQSFDDDPLTKHQGCGGKLAKVLSTPGIVLKGSGFYRTDNRNGSSRGGGSSKEKESASESGSSSSSDSGSAEKSGSSKKDAASEKKSDSGSTKSSDKASKT